MPMNSEIATMRIVRDLASSEETLDRAIASNAALLATMAQARLDTEAPVATGQVAIMRLVKTLSSLTEARADLVRTHGELLKVGQERGDFATEDCPPSAAAMPAPIAQAA